ncbi:uncharacterized protein LOC132296026 [Cornus florida]|uniref:uncharacterized protein LOC132296026 n=1 Tax=Cornus florida TaxID=4283 RepID=UPI00289F313D|nr:uncharacterized protein LOC132296026 [Cornus florida]
MGNLQDMLKVRHKSRTDRLTESEKLLKTRLRQAQMKRRIGSVHVLHQQNALAQIKFDITDLLRVQVPHENPLVVSLIVAECLVRRVLIDPGSSVNVMPRITFDRLEIEPEKLKATGNPLLGFNEKQVEPIGMVELTVQAAKRILTESFVVVEIHPSYNLLMGRGWIHRVQGVPSTLHQVMRCLGPNGTKVIDIHGDQDPPPNKSGEEKPSVLTEEPLLDVQIGHKKPDRTTRVGSKLVEEEKQWLIDFLTQNADMFAWSHSDMPRISPFVSYHFLNVDPNAKPVKQKQRRFAPERNRIIAQEINRLLDARFIREDNFTLPMIDQMVDATTGYERLTFLDAYSGYNQIPMDQIDEEKTSFVTERGTYCYKVMPFGLKNVGATYQMLISKIFKSQMGRIVEACIDDMVVKSKKKNDHLEHLQDVFGVLRKYEMKFNPTKCSFGVSSGQFFGYVVNYRGIEASPTQAEALIRNAGPKTIKEVQALTGRIAALSRFISKLSDRCKPFFDTIRGHGRQAWGMNNDRH